MRRRLCMAMVALLAVRPAMAFFDPVTIGLASWFTTSIGMPVTYLLGCAFAYSPPVRAFGSQHAVYGLDWGSLACHAENVYGVQLACCGGNVEESLYGLQLGILASGYAQEELPFDEYHFCNTSGCFMNGLQFGTFAAKTATANGFQLSVGYAEAKTVNGVQFALVTSTRRLRGLQLGLYNSASAGLGLQVGLVNSARHGLAGWLPLLNLVY